MARPLTALTLSILVTLALSRLANGEPQPQKGPEQTAADPPTSPELQEILEIRRQTGEILNGSSLQQAGQNPSHFLKALQRAAGGSSNPSGQATAALPGPVSSKNVAPSNVAPSNVAPSNVAPSNMDPLAATMLRLCQQMDQRAAELERNRRTVQADQLRRTAHRLRRQARQLNVARQSAR